MIAAVIFDMDDTLISSRTTWQPAETRLYNALGSDYRPDIAKRYRGLNAADVGRTIHDALKPAEYTDADCARLMREYLIDAFDSTVRPMPGADELLRRLHGRFPLAVASGSPMAGIRKAMEAVGWADYFHILVTSEDVERGKPEPDVFLEAARQLRLPPEQCLVIEDSLAGLNAARAAGMPCFVVGTDGPPELGEKADRLYTSLAEIEPAHIHAAHRD